MAKEWIKYNCGTLPGHRGFDLKIPRELTEIYHVAHIDTALRIMKDDKIRAGLIGDKSRLKEKRVPVSWLSPNIWINGSRYGNIAFTYDFKKLVKEKNYYWVEVMTEYSPDAPRILITDLEYDYLEQYDPETDKGPWKYDSRSDRHFWNGSICLEFMFESDIPLKFCKEIRTVRHHAHFCSLDPKNCLEKNQTERAAGLKFYSALITEGLAFYYNQHTTGKGGTPKESLSDTLGTYYVKSSRQDFTGTVKCTSNVAEALVRASLSALANRNNSDYRLLLNEFRSHEDYMNSLRKIVETYFEISSFEIE